MPDEEALIRRSRAGELEAFNGLVETYQGQVYNLALRLLGHHDEAEDATQEAFISAFRALDSFRGGSFRAWLMRIASNASYDILRRRKRQPVPLDDLVIEPRGPAAEDPEDYTLRRELGRNLTEALAGLPQEQRTAIVLFDVQGLNLEEVSQATGASVGTVKSRLSRGRARLRDLLRGKGVV